MIVDKVFDLLGGYNDPNYGVSYGMSENNRWEKLLDTPRLWGHNPAVNDYEPTAQNLLQAITELLASAEYTIDISTLTPLPYGLFLEAIKEGIEAAIAKGHRPVVRVLEGVYFPLLTTGEPTSKMVSFLRELSASLDIPIYVGAMQSSALSWNHSKLIIVDGKRAICGGHNLWSSDYTGFGPVHDVSMQLSGPTITTAQNFLNKIWSVLAGYSRGCDIAKWYWSRLIYKGNIYKNALPVIKHNLAEPTGDTKVLALGRMGDGLVDASPSANASQTARIAAIQNAKSHIRLSQQMIGVMDVGKAEGISFGFDNEFVRALATHISQGRDLYLIVADSNGTSGVVGGTYAGVGGVKEAARYIGEVVSKVSGKKGAALIELLSAHLYVAPIRIYDKQPDDPKAESWKWRKDKRVVEPGNHAKVCIYDDEAFYIGSDNAYGIVMNPQGLQEFGFMISGHEETAALVEEYWNKAWHYSSQFLFKDWASLFANK
ncbi:hypothetical protein I2492_03160 [Budviciaceae bacterium CWB-B4]|uniref:PLD phosphodiesterase domain-containing protein n=1 Tax=Limnobaculum xujianqingii TaxID=2738837 RepID=A0A9D7FWB6_9GAMM|nr:hypothetical protein [Limnobaculum xujianqingii]MBK5072017.1 hypothetical protein [Limnobaculum xujianqingii]MBK5175326.1 hypothetical protein [Limnobaculum xujianqingii]